LDAFAADRESSDPLFRLDGETSRRGQLAACYSYEGQESQSSAVGYVNLRSTRIDRTRLLAPGLADRTMRALSTSTFGGSVWRAGLVREAAAGADAGTDHRGRRALRKRGLDGGARGVPNARRRRDRFRQPRLSPPERRPDPARGAGSRNQALRRAAPLAERLVH